MGRICVRTGLTLLALVCVAVAGCSRGPGIVPVRGRVTLNGGEWPKPGYIDFTPVKAAEGFPLIPAVARFEADGSYSVKTGQLEGLMPGEYRIAVRCWQREPTDAAPGKNYVPVRFTHPATSGLELKVPPDSGPIEQDWDIPNR